MSSMLRNINLHGRWLNILLILLLGFFVFFANVSGQIQKPTPSTITLNATIYLPTATLKPILQSHVNQQLQSNNPNWIQSLIHPSITKLTPQSNGLAMTLSQSLYPGDPQPIESSTLLTFNVLNPSTIQVSAQPMQGSSLSLNGPLTQINLPKEGHVNSISPTPNCGDSALAVKMSFPISTDQGPVLSQTKSGLLSEAIPHTPTNTANAYVEVPSSALSSLGKDLSSVPINDSQSLTAQNIRISIQNNEIIVRSDLSLWQTGIVVGSGTMHIQPLVKNGNLLLDVKQTDLSVLFFTFSADSYNQQIQDILNQQMATSLGSLFTVTSVTIGTDKHIPCMASDSLILAGTTDMLS
jgi:hypothetical protein